MKLLLQLLFAFSAVAQTITVEWSPSVSPNVASYTVWAGTNSGNYTTNYPTGAGTNVTVALPSPGLWYFAVTATDTNSLTSVPSAEVSAMIGVQAQRATPTPPFQFLIAQ
jgi:hypothetical protein